MSKRKAIISGIICSDINFTSTSKGTPRAKFTVAVNEVSGGEKISTFIPCTSYSNLEFLKKHFHKGKPIEVEGKLNPYTYTRKDGSKGNGFEVLVTEIGFCPVSKSENADDSDSQETINDNTDAQ